MILSRRAALAALGALVIAPRGADSQQAARIPRVGIIGERTPEDPFLSAFRAGLRELGYVEGRSIALEIRYLRGALDRAPALAAELVRSGVDVILVGGTVSARAALTATPTVPIVFVQVGDPVGSGLVASLARPGGQVTGLSNLFAELTGKQLELLKTAVPALARAAILCNPSSPVVKGALETAREAGRALSIELQAFEVRRPEDLAGAFAALRAWHAGGVVAFSDPVIGNRLAELSALGLRSRLPVIYSRREFTQAGGLLAYGPSFEDNYRRAATYVDKILKGARPADLPVEQPTKFELAVNLRTARALGLSLPASLLGRADEVIQ